MSQNTPSSDGYTTMGKAGTYLLIALTIIVIESLSIFAATQSMTILQPKNMLYIIASPFMFNIVFWAYLGEFVYLSGNNWQRFIAIVGAVLTGIATIYMGWLYLDLTSALNMTDDFRNLRSWELLHTFEIAFGFHFTMHGLLIVFSNYVINQMAKQARLIKLAWRVRNRADKKIESDIEELSDIESDDVQAEFRAAHGWTKRNDAPVSTSAKSGWSKPVIHLEQVGDNATVWYADGGIEYITMSEFLKRGPVWLEQSENGHARTTEPPTFKKAQRPIRKAKAQASPKPGTSSDTESRAWQATQQDATQEVPKG